MKILIISQTYPPVRGGAEALASDLASWLAKKGERVSVVTTNARNARDLSEKPRTLLKQGLELMDGIEIRRLGISGGIKFRLIETLYFSGVLEPFRSKSRPMLTALRWSPLVANLITTAMRIKPDIVLALPFPFVTMYGAYLAARILRIPLITIPCIHPRQEEAFSKGWIRKVLRASARIICLSRRECETVELMGVSHGRISVLPAGSTIPAGQPPGIEATEYQNPVFSFIGRIERGKGIDLLISAWQDVLAEHPGSKLVIAGEPTPYKEEVRKMISCLGGNQTSVDLRTGPHHGNEEGMGIGEDEKLALILSSRAVIVPSANEAFGRVILEAWSQSRPVIVSSGGGSEEVVRDGIDGIVFRINDPHSLASSIKELCRGNSLSTRLGKNGKGRVEGEFSWERLGPLYLDLIYKTFEEQKG